MGSPTDPLKLLQLNIASWHQRGGYGTYEYDPQLNSVKDYPTAASTIYEYGASFPSHPQTPFNFIVLLLAVGPNDLSPALDYTIKLR